MSTYRRYQDARDTAWRALLRLRVTCLPVDAEALARRLGMDVHPFPDEKEEPRLAALVRRAGKGVCVSLRIRGAWNVFLRPGLSDDQRRFALAHEMGHLLLDHGARSLAPGVRAFRSEENEGDLMEDPRDMDDYAADIFAIRLLAPACVLHEMHIDQSGRIMALCGLPPRAAAARAERMELLNRRDAFFTHPLEKQVRDQFLPFIRGLGTASAVREKQPRAVTAPLPKRPRERDAEKPPEPVRMKRRRRAAAWLLPVGMALAAGALIFLAFLRR